MRNRTTSLVALITLASALAGGAAGHLSGQDQSSNSVSEIIRRVVANENDLVRSLALYQPRVETYIQEFRADPELGSVPTNDHYFLGILDTRSGFRERSLLPARGRGERLLTNLADDVTRLYQLHYQPRAFAYTIAMDVGRFDQQHYRFDLVRTEFLGSVRCLAFDVTPNPRSGAGLFKGRIWVEDRDYHVVRFNGTYVSHPKFDYYFHFDSWRQNLQPGLWMPVYVYSEESNLKYAIARTLRFKAQTRLWGYDLTSARHQQAQAWVIVDAPSRVEDTSPETQPLSPIESQRQWETEAEKNVLDRLQSAGLLAPPGDVEKVLETVINNLLVTNHLDNLPPIHCRVLLTAPLESLALGNTIVVSRGLVDVLPDEATLGLVLAHELGHILLGHTQNTLDSRFAFYDRTLVPDEDLLRVLDFRRTGQQEEAADRKAMELMGNSPYRDKLTNAGLFLEALQATASHAPKLVGAHLSDRLSARPLARMPLVNGAPQLQPDRLDQIAALPLGSRIVLDAWSDRITLMKPASIPLLSAREKKPFEITPLFPYLTRFETVQPAAEQTAR